MSSLQVIPREMRANGKSVVVENDTTLVPARSLDALANAARYEHDLVTSAAEKMVQHAVRCGDVLLEARQRVPRGEWYAWMERNLPFAQSTASVYMRMAAFADVLEENGVRSISGAIQFLREHSLSLDDQISADKAATIRSLRAIGLTYDQIAEATGVSKPTVRRYVTDPAAGTRRRSKAPKKSGRKATRFNVAITDDLIEGAALKLREIFGSGGDPTDSDRDTAVEILRAAFTYGGPIRGEK